MKIFDENISIENTSINTGLDNQNINPTTNRKLEVLIDMIGRKTKIKKHIPQIYIYNDGSVEKKIIIE